MTFQSEDGKTMAKTFQLNGFATSYILHVAGSFEAFALEMTEKERIEAFLPVLGRYTNVRLQLATSTEN